MVSWQVVFTAQAQKDAQKIARAGLTTKAQRLIDIFYKNHFQTPPPFEKLVGDLSGAYARRITIQQRLVDQIYEQEKVVKVLRLWTHYE